jgi:hypothetical protein
MTYDTNSEDVEEYGEEEPEVDYEAMITTAFNDIYLAINNLNRRIMLLESEIYVIRYAIRDIENSSGRTGSLITFN